jgi:hypothetical protein
VALSCTDTFHDAHAVVIALPLSETTRAVVRNEVTIE